MNKFLFWVSNFMRGRYGQDELNRKLIILTFILIIVNIFMRIGLLNLLVLGLIVYTYFRMFSKNYYARQRENIKFLNFMNKFSTKRKMHQGMNNGYKNNSYTTNDKTYTIVKCPSCGQKVRVPKGLGKINITCPHCQTKFIKKI